MDTEFRMSRHECYHHPGVASKEVCDVCGKPLCSECFVRLDRGIVCEESEHKAVLELWTMIVRSKSEFEADMVVRNLQLQGIGTKVYSSRVFKLRIGEDSRDDVKVFVLREECERARGVLGNLELPGIEMSNQKSEEKGPNFV